MKIARSALLHPATGRPDRAAIRVEVPPQTPNPWGGGPPSRRRSLSSGRPKAGPVGRHPPLAGPCRGRDRSAPARSACLHRRSLRLGLELVGRCERGLLRADVLEQDAAILKILLGQAVAVCGCGRDARHCAGRNRGRYPGGSANRHRLSPVGAVPTHIPVHVRAAPYVRTAPVMIAVAIMVVVMVMIMVAASDLAIRNVQVRSADRAAGMGDAAFGAATAMIVFMNAATKPLAATARSGAKPFTATLGGVTPLGAGFGDGIGGSERRGSEQGQRGQGQGVGF